MNVKALGEKIEAGGYRNAIRYPEHPDGGLRLYRRKKVLFRNGKPTKAQVAFTKALVEYHEGEQKKQIEFNSDLRSSVNSALGFSLSDGSWKVFFDKVWDKGHSAGYSEVLQEAQDEVDLILPLLEDVRNLQEA